MKNKIEFKSLKVNDEFNDTELIDNGSIDLFFDVIGRKKKVYSITNYNDRIIIARDIGDRTGIVMNTIDY